MKFESDVGDTTRPGFANSKSLVSNSSNDMQLLSMPTYKPLKRFYRSRLVKEKKKSNKLKVKELIEGMSHSSKRHLSTKEQVAGEVDLGS